MSVAFPPAGVDLSAASDHCPGRHTPFLLEHCTWLWLDQAVPLVHCRFDLAAYRDSLFEQLQIPLPDAIGNCAIRRRAEFLAGRYCATRALQHLGLQDNFVDIGERRNPVWPRGFTGSISHSHGEAVAVVMHQGINGRPPASQLRGLGVDIEKTVSRKTAANIGRRVLTSAERQLLATSGLSPELSLTLAFSAKESFFKASYPAVKRYLDFDAVSVTDIDPQLRCLKLRINQPLHRRLPPGREVEVCCQMLEADRIMTWVIVD